MALVYTVTREVWECGACKRQWIGRGGSVPKQCPNRGCRKRLCVGVKEMLGRQVRVPEGVLVRNVDEIAERIALSPTMSAKERGHDVRGCRVYRCGRCAGLGVEDAGRGL